MSEVADGPSRRTWLRRIARPVVLYVLVPYIAVTLSFAVVQRRLIYRPEKAVSLLAVPERFLPHFVEDVLLRADDGLKLNGWLIRSTAWPGASDDGQTTRSLVIYFPGNSGNREMRRVDLKEIAAAGADVLIVDYRGYGDNPGSPSEEALAADAHLIWRAATEAYRYPPDRIVVFGESLGGAVAVRLCAELSDSATPPSALIVTSTFSSLPNVAAWSYPAFPFRFLLLDQFDSASRIGRVRCPVTVIHGTEDQMIPIGEGRRLFDAAPVQSLNGVPKRWEQVAGMGHNDVPTQLLRQVLATTEHSSH